jgi:excisionase family DNA binding protein
MSENTNNQVQGFLRVKQIIKLLGIGKSTFYTWVKEGRISKGIKLGERIRVWKAEEIYTFIDNAGKTQEA